jgi:hypothetical protein
MKFLKNLPAVAAPLLLASAALAHEGHGVVGSVGHDLQHQLWNFAGLILLGVLVLGGEYVAALVRRKPGDKDR